MAHATAIAMRIRQARRAAGLSQTELGRRLNPPRSHAAISDIERGKTRLTIDTINMIADELSLEPLVLLNGSGVNRVVYRGHGQVVADIEQSIERFQELARSRARAR